MRHALEAKAPEDWRTPQASPDFTPHTRSCASFWTAAVLCRFGFYAEDNLPSNNSRLRHDLERKAPEDWRAPQASPDFTPDLPMCASFWTAAAPCRFGFCTQTVRTEERQKNKAPFPIKKET